MKKNKGGRPTKLTEAVIGKLEEAFAMGCTDLEACLLAGITPPTLYDYQKKNPEFQLRKEMLKTSVIAEARDTLRKSIRRGNGDLALKYLERKVKDELSLRSEITGNAGEPVTFSWVDPDTK